MRGKRLGEIQAVKTEITEAILRRVKGDGRDPSHLYSTASVALAEVMADIIFAAAKDREHAHGLLRLLVAQIENRWRQLEQSS